MQLTADAPAAQKVRQLALVFSHVLSPAALATLLLLSTPPRRAPVGWSDALTAGSILGGLLLLQVMKAGGAMFR